MTIKNYYLKTICNTFIHSENLNLRYVFIYSNIVYRLYIAKEAEPIIEGRPADPLYVTDPTVGDSLRNFPDQTLVAWTALPLLAPYDNRVPLSKCEFLETLDFR